jgi:glycosyltransferase involved in cell wall biosynthesis
VVLLEALSSGLPVVAPATGGITEVITAECGLLFQPGNLEDLVNKLHALLTDLNAFNKQTIHQYAVDHFSPEVVGKWLDGIYRQVLRVDD